LKLMIDGVSSKGFSAQTIPPFPKLERSNRETIIEHSRKTYATPRENVEKIIAEWAGPTEMPKETFGGPSPRPFDGLRPMPAREQSQPRSYPPSFRQPERRQTFSPPERPRYAEPRPSQGPRTVDFSSRRAEPVVSRPVPFESKHQSQPPRLEKPVSQTRPGISLNDALKQGPVNFRGRRIEERKERPKVEVNTDELRKALEEAMVGSKE